MDLIAEKLIDKELREIRHRAAYDTLVVFEDGAITAWTEVRSDIAFGDDPVRVKELVWSDDWCEILLDRGRLRISRIPSSRNPECFVYGSTCEPSVTIVDRGAD